MRGSHRIQESHRRLQAVPPLPDSPTADAFAADDTIFVQVTGPESARVLHIDVHLDGPQKNGAERSERPPTPPAERPAFRVHPDATPC
jgi:hypothetical protein